MFEIIAALVGVLATYGVQWLSKRKEKNLMHRIAEGESFRIYSDLEAPDEIWRGFKKDFKSFNDSWKMEMVAPEDFLPTHIKRYNEPDCGTYRFLFFVDKNLNSESWKPFIRFAKFQSMVHLKVSPKEINTANFAQNLAEKLKAPMPSTLKYIKVYLNYEDKPTTTFFRGYKAQENGRLQKTALWYLNIDTESELPHLILKSTDKRFWKDLDDTWNKYREKAKLLEGKEIFNKVLELI